MYKNLTYIGSYSYYLLLLKFKIVLLLQSILNPNNSKTVNDTFYTLHFSNLNAPINFVNKQVMLFIFLI